jgi:hypothetical protein
VLPTGPPWPTQRNWTAEIQAATTPPGIRDPGRLHHLLAWDRRGPQDGRPMQLLRHHGMLPRPRQSRDPLGPSGPRTGPVAKRRHQPPATSTTRSSLPESTPRAPSAPPMRRRGAAAIEPHRPAVAGPRRRARLNIYQARSLMQTGLELIRLDM